MISGKARSLQGLLRRRAHTLAALLLVFMAGLLVHGALAESPTIDEPNHVARGLAYLSTGDARLSFGHPPLGNMLQAIPGWLLERPVDVRSMRGWKEPWSADKVAKAWLGRDYERARTAIVGGRLVTSLLTLLLGLYLYRFCLRFGRRRALLTVALYACTPVFLAHGHLATTDMPVTVAVAIAVGEFVRWMEGRSWLRFLTFSLAAGAAFATKYSALFLVPTLGLVGLVAALRGHGPLASLSTGRRFALFCRDFVLVAAIAVLVVNAAYRFQRTGWSVEETLAAPEPTNWITSRYKGELLEQLSPLASLPGWLPVPLPYPWVFGLHSIRAHNERGHGGWFWGSSEPSRLYFPTLAVIKTPAALLLLLLAAAGLLAWRRRLPSPPRLALWLPPLFLFCSAIFSDIQIGVRHLLPIFPFVVMAAGWAAMAVSLRWPLATGAVVLLAAVEAVGSAPSWIGHFSLAIGGPKVGHRISMIAEDWGQDTRALADLARTAGWEPLYYRPYGPAAGRELRRAGVKYRSFSCRTKVTEPAWVAIHATHLVRMESCGPIPFDREPDHKVGEHIWVYRVEPTDEPPPKPRLHGITPKSLAAERPEGLPLPRRDRAGDGPT